MRPYAHRVVTLAVVLLGVCTPRDVAAAKWWTWSKPKPYHASVVIVNAGNHGGTGVLVSKDGLIMTAAHVTDPHSEATATWTTGHKSSGPIVNIDRSRDVCVFKVSSVPQDAVVAPVAASEPEMGAVLDHCGFGGDASLLKRLRAFTGEISGKSQYVIHSKANVISGDSGGPVFNTEGQLVGIISGGANKKDVGVRDRHGGPWPLVYPTRMASTRVVRNMLFTQRLIGGRRMPALCPPGGT